jgi:ribosomal protein S18 acetylase RimI-like enzyme
MSGAAGGRGQPPLGHRLEWDSEHFGFPIARVAATTLAPDGAAQVLAWCRGERIRCLYFLATSGDDDSVRTAEQSGFHLVDVRVTLTRSVEAVGELPGGPVAVRPFRPVDVPLLRAMAADSFGDTRFLVDHGFPRDRAAALYDRWLTQSCSGYAEAVLVAVVDDKPTGFITCHLDPNATGRIGLVSVSGRAQGGGVGHALVTAALRYFERAGMRTVSVVTQGRNIRAQRLYQRCGFRSAAVDLWYHRWFDDDEHEAGKTRPLDRPR